MDLAQWSDTSTVATVITLLAVLIGGWWLIAKVLHRSATAGIEETGRSDVRYIDEYSQLERIQLETLKSLTTHGKDIKGFWPESQPEEESDFRILKKCLEEYFGENNTENTGNILHMGIVELNDFIESKCGSQVSSSDMSEKLFSFAFVLMQLVLLGAPDGSESQDDLNRLKEHLRSAIMLRPGYADGYKSTESCSLSTQQPLELEDVKEKCLNTVISILKKIQNGNASEKTYANLLLESTEKMDDNGLKTAATRIAKLLVIGTESLFRSLKVCLASLSARSDVQDKICAELRKINNGQDLCSREIIENKSSLPVATAVVLEALRLRTAVPKVFYRDCKAADVKFTDDRVMPEGAKMVAVDFHKILTDPKIWENPTEFVPERFVDPLRKEISNDKGFVPFGSNGERSCPAQAFVEITSLVLITSLVQKFHLREASLTGDDGRDRSNDSSFPNLSISSRNPTYNLD